MGKKQLLFLIVGIMCLVLGLKIFLLKSANEDLNPAAHAPPATTAGMPPEWIALQDQINDEKLSFDDRTQAIDTIARGPDRDLAIVTLEKLEEKQKTTPIGDRLRRAIVRLRFNK